MLEQSRYRVDHGNLVSLMSPEGRVAELAQREAVLAELYPETARLSARHTGGSDRHEVVERVHRSFISKRAILIHNEIRKEALVSGVDTVLKADGQPASFMEVGNVVIAKLSDLTSKLLIPPEVDQSLSKVSALVADLKARTDSIDMVHDDDWGEEVESILRQVTTVLVELTSARTSRSAGHAS